MEPLLKPDDKVRTVKLVTNDYQYQKIIPIRKRRITYFRKDNKLSERLKIRSCYVETKLLYNLVIIYSI